MAGTYKKGSSKHSVTDVVDLKERLVAFLERHIPKHREIRSELYNYLRQVKRVDAGDDENVLHNYARLKAVSRAVQTIVIRNSTLLDRIRVVCRARNYELPVAVENTVASYEQRVRDFINGISEKSVRAAARDWLLRFWVEPILHRFSRGYLFALDDIGEQDEFALWFDDFTRQKLTELKERVERWQQYLEKYRPSALEKFTGCAEDTVAQANSATEGGGFEIPF